MELSFTLGGTPGESGQPAVVCVHGLNRSRQELFECVGEARQRGYGALLLEYRNHGESGDECTTLGIDESQDVCAAAQFIEMVSLGREKMFWAYPWADRPPCWEPRGVERWVQ